MQDLVRFVLISLACIVVASVAVVVKMHFVSWRKLPAGQGLLPLHVWLVSIAHLCFVAGTGLAVLESVHTGAFSWRFYLYVAGSACTIIALVSVAIYVRRRQAMA